MNVPGLVALIALIGISGCGQRTPPESRTERADSTPAPGVPRAPQVDSVLVALGNEPFWNVRVTTHEILYRDPEHQDGYRFPPVSAVEQDGARVFHTQRDIPAGDPSPRVLELRVRPGTCSDGMSDRQYSMIAQLKIGEATLAGCAWSEPDTSQGRTGGR